MTNQKGHNKCADLYIVLEVINMIVMVMIVLM